MPQQSKRILIVHNHYGNFVSGGEGGVARAEAALLKEKGHEVHLYERANHEITSAPFTDKLRQFWHSPWSAQGLDAVSDVLTATKPDILHVHNYAWLLSPSIFLAARQQNVPTVFTLHNYRLVCPSGMFLYKDGPCEQCMDGKPKRVLWRRCNPQNSLVTSIASYRLFKETVRHQHLAGLVDVYIALSDFGRAKLAEGGVPANQIAVKPNFIVDPFSDPAPSRPGEGALYVGRLSPEKGLPLLMRAWRNVDYPLTIVGSGPQLEELREIAPPTVSFVGDQPRHKVFDYMAAARFVIFPSQCYEGLPLVVLEAMAAAKPVIASDLGARRELITHVETGLLYPFDNVERLRESAQLLIRNRELCERLGRNARKRYLDHFSPDVNYGQLLRVYERAIESNLARGRAMESVATPVSL